MEKDIKDYAQYYIGCRCLNTWFTPDHEMYDNRWVLAGYLYASVKPYQLYNGDEVTWTDSIKPILRKIESITEEECEQYNKIRLTMHSINKSQDQMKTDAAATHYLLKRDFDLYGLIDAGLAVDEKTLTK